MGGNAESYKNESTDLDDPALSAVSITPDNDTDLVENTRYLMVAVSGAVSVDMVGSGTNVQLFLTAGHLHAVRVKRIRATGTAATGIVALR